MADIAPQFGIIRDSLGGSAGVGVDLGGNLYVSGDNRTRLVYTAVAVGLAPAASCTDVLTLIGSATKTIRLLRMSISGTAGTLVSLPMFLARRVSLNTGGTPATGNALPVASKLDSGDAAATATLNAYTANPTIVDASPTLIRAGTVTLPVTSAGTSINPLVWDFTMPGFKAAVLRGAAQSLNLNLNSVSVTSGLLNVELQWAEDAS